MWCVCVCVCVRARARARAREFVKFVFVTCQLRLFLKRHYLQKQNKCVNYNLIDSSQFASKYEPKYEPECFRKFSIPSGRIRHCAIIAMHSRCGAYQSGRSRILSRSIAAPFVFVSRSHSDLKATCCVSRRHINFYL